MNVGGNTRMIGSIESKAFEESEILASVRHPISSLRRADLISAAKYTLIFAKWHKIHQDTPPPPRRGRYQLGHTEFGGK